MRAWRKPERSHLCGAALDSKELVSPEQRNKHERRAGASASIERKQLRAKRGNNCARREETVAREERKQAREKRGSKCGKREAKSTLLWANQFASWWERRLPACFEMLTTNRYSRQSYDPCSDSRHSFISFCNCKINSPAGKLRISGAPCPAH